MNLADVAEFAKTMVEGKTYRLTHKSDIQRKTYESRMRFIGLDGPNLVMNARPVARIHLFPMAWISGIELADDNASIYINRIIE